MISPDFEDRRVQNVRLQVERGNFSEEKQRQAIDWLDEQGHFYQRRADIKSTLTLVIAIIATLTALLSLGVSVWNVYRETCACQTLQTTPIPQKSDTAPPTQPTK